MIDISISFSNKIRKDFDSLDFFYGGEKINLNETLSQIINHNDLNRSEMHINVQEKNFKENEYPKEKGIVSKNNKKLFIIIFSIFDVLFITIFLTVLFEVILKKRDKETRNIDICLTYVNSSSNDCKLCRSKFYLYKGQCIPYTFYAVYQVDYINEKFILFNPDNIENIYAIKIKNEVLNQTNEYAFNKIGIHKVYYFIFDNINISLSNM